MDDDAALRRERVVDATIEDLDAIALLPLSVHLDSYGSAMATKSKQGHIDDTRVAIEKMGDIRLTMDRYGHLFPGSEAAAIERIRSVFTQSVELRKTGTTDPQQFQQQSGCDSVRARCELVPLGATNHHALKNEKTQRFPENTEEKAGFSGERLRWELNPRWRICNPLP